MSTKDDDDSVFDMKDGDLKGALSTSMVLNSTFNTVKRQSEELLTSPNIVQVNNNALVEKANTCKCNCKCGKETDEEKEARMMKILIGNVNQMLAEYFGDSGSFKPQLKRLVESEVAELVTNTSIIPNDTSITNTPNKEVSNLKPVQTVPDPSTATELEKRVSALELDKQASETSIPNISASVERVESHVQALYQDIAICRSDQASGFSLYHEQLSALQNVCQGLIEESDAQEQYTRLEILVLDGIQYQWYRGKEDVYGSVISFFRKYLGINVSLRDISICHRQFNPRDKKRMGKNYIESIYVKFLNRSLVKTILKKRYLLKNFPQFRITENLTLNRRIIHERVQQELVSYPISWVSNGNIFVKKRGGQPTMVNTVSRLEELLELQIEELSASQKNIEKGPPVQTEKTMPKASSTDQVSVLPPSSSYATATQENPIKLPNFNSSAADISSAPEEMVESNPKRKFRKSQDNTKVINYTF